MENKMLKRILYAEDEDDIRAIAQVALEDIGHFSVKYCSSGVELLKVIRDFQPELILLDVMMPEMDGVTTLLELRKINEFAHTPVIFMTAKIQPEELNEYKKMGALGVVVKPFDPMKLTDEILTIWNHYHGQRYTK